MAAPDLLDLTHAFRSLARLIDVGAAVVTPERELAFISRRARGLLALDAKSGDAACWARLKPLAMPAIERLGADAVGGAQVEAEYGPDDDALDAFAVARLLVEAHDVVDEAGQRAGYLVLLKDGDSLAHLHQSLRLAMEMENTRRLYRALAHDLRQPATAVLIHLDILRELATSLGNGDAQAQAERSLTAIEGVTREFDEAFALLMEELAPDEDVGGEGPVRLPAIARAVARLVGPQAAKQGVAFGLDMPGDETPDDDGAALVVRGHRRALKQAILNLTTNALEAMPEGGTLTLHLRRTDGHAVLLVEDDGPGIAPEVQAHMFDLHYSTKAEGSGIGLYAVKRTLEQHGGTVEVESAEDAGTRVRLRLPLVALG